MSPQRIPSVPDLARRLAQTTLALVDTPSESRSEAPIGEVVAAMIDTRLPSLMQDDSLVYAPERRAGVPLVVFAGHLDTVPAQNNLPGRVAGGAVHGLGASDMTVSYTHLTLPTIYSV